MAISQMPNSSHFRNVKHSWSICLGWCSRCRWAEGEGTKFRPPAEQNKWSGHGGEPKTYGFSITVVLLSGFLAVPEGQPRDDRKEAGTAKDSSYGDCGGRTDAKVRFRIPACCRGMAFRTPVGFRDQGLGEKIRYLDIRNEPGPPKFWKSLFRFRRRIAEILISQYQRHQCRIFCSSINLLYLRILLQSFCFLD